MGRSISSPAPFGDTLVIPEEWEPVLSSPCSFLAHPTPVPPFLLLELPVNLRYLGCSARHLHLKQASSEEEDSDQINIFGE